MKRDAIRIVIWKNLSRNSQKPKDRKKTEEPIAQPGILKRAVFGIGSTALGAGKSLILGAKYVVGMGGTKAPEVPQEPDKKETVVKKKKSHRRRRAGVKE